MRARIVVALLVSLATVATTFLPWAQSGERVRSSHELVDVASRAGVLPDGTEPLATVWFLVPALGALVVLTAGLGRYRLTGLLATTLGALVGVGGLLLHRSPLIVRAGATAGLLAGAVAVGTGLVLALGAERSNADERRTRRAIDGTR